MRDIEERLLDIAGEYADAEIREEAAAFIKDLREQKRKEILHWEHQNGLLETKNERLQSIIKKQMSPTEISRKLAECNELADAYAEQKTTIKDLREQIATCRELREYDRKKIEQLRAEIELVSK
jgi:chromosome condensin MukBEF ATPase and DNA-binding subunit MukB